MMPHSLEPSVCTSSLLLETLAEELRGELSRPTQLFEQYISLHQPDAVSAQQLLSLTQWQQEQLEMVATIFNSLVKPPTAKPQRINLNAYMWELLVASAGSAYQASKPAESFSVMLEQTLLTPLLEQFIRESYYAAAQPLVFEVTRPASSAITWLTLGPQEAFGPTLKTNWMNIDDFLDQHSSAALKHHKLSISYLLALQVLPEITLNLTDNAAVAMRLACESAAT